MYLLTDPSRKKILEPTLLIYNFFNKNNYQVLHGQAHHALSSKINIIMVSCQVLWFDSVVQFSSRKKKKKVINK